MFSCLILTPWMMPHTIAAWQESIALDYLGKVDVLERYEETVSSPTVTIRIPAVARLTKAMAAAKRDVKFSRANIYQRDRYTCQYCGKRPPVRELTYDHVTPRSKGGKTVWENIATACRACNSKKDNRTPKQAGMRLLKKPEEPSSLPMVTMIVLPREVPDLWLPYLNDRLSTLRTA